MAAPDAFVEISFRSLTLGSTLRNRIANRGAGHNVYAIATIGKKNAPTMARQLGRSALIDGSANVIDLTTQRMAWSHAIPVAKTDIVTATLTIIDDELDKAPVELFTLSYDFDPAWDDETPTLTSGEVSVVCQFRGLRGFPSEAPRAVAIGDDNRNTIAKPAIVRAEITSIKGLFRPTGTSPSTVAVGTPIGPLSAEVDGYSSEDNKGRVFINRNPENGAWTKGMQYIDIEVQLTITGMIRKSLKRRRDGMKVKWTVYVPDDPTDDDRNIHRSEGVFLDRDDYVDGVQRGAAGYDNQGTNAKWVEATHVWEQIEDWTMTVGAAADPVGVPSAMTVDDTNTPYLKPAETATEFVDFRHGIATHYRDSAIRFHCPNRRGDRFIIRAEPVDTGPSVCIPAQTGIITMWDRLDVEYRKMATAYELPIAAVPQHFEKLFAQMDFTKEGNITDIARLEMKDVAAFIDTNFTKRTTAGWFNLISILRLGEAMNPRDAYAGTTRLRNASAMIGDATQDPLKFFSAFDDSKEETERVAKAVKAAEKAVKDMRKLWAYEFIDVPVELDDKPTVVFRWPVLNPTVTVNFDQCRVEKIPLEDWDSNRGTRQRLRFLGYRVGFVTRDDFSRAESAELARFSAANTHLATRLGRLVDDDEKKTLTRKWLQWRLVTRDSTNATGATDRELDAAAAIDPVASRVWILPHDVQNKFTAGDGSYDHAIKHRLMFGPVFRERIEDNASKAITRNGYGAPDDVSVTIKDLSVERKGESPATTLTVLLKKVLYFAGQTLIATGHPSYRPQGLKAADFDEEILIAVVHELTHAFGMPHKCARWDTAALRANTCCMNYTPNWMVKAADDTLVADTARKVGSGMCGMHVREVRRVILEDNKALQSRNWT